MSETVKLIIEIPEKEYETVKKLKAINIGGRGSGKEITYACLNAVKNGTPLEEVRTEIIQLPLVLFEGHFLLDNDSVLKIIDNIGKGDKEKC